MGVSGRGHGILRGLFKMGNVTVYCAPIGMIQKRGGGCFRGEERVAGAVTLSRHGGWDPGHKWRVV